MSKSGKCWHDKGRYGGILGSFHCPDCGMTAYSFGSAVVAAMFVYGLFAMLLLLASC